MRVEVALILCVALLVSVSVFTNSVQEETGRPNIIVIMTDDQRWDDLQYMPTLQERLIGEGTYFTNSFVTTSLCCPSRASFLTGQYAHNHGIFTNSADTGGGATNFKDTSTLATWLHNAGYTTSAIGKYMNEYGKLSPYIPPGWDDWHVFSTTAYYNYELNENGVIIQYGKETTDYSTDVLRNKAVSFVSNTQTPFFLWLSFTAPHVDGLNPTHPVSPAPRHLGTCSSIPVNRPPSFNEADISDKPYWVRNVELWDAEKIAKNDLTYRKRICSLKAVDEAIDAIINALGDKLGNTAIIYTSDNGFLLGEHRLKGKNQIYEESIRVPLVIRYPRIFPSTVNDKLVLNIDLAPTIADLAGAVIPPTHKVNGKSLVASLRDETWRNDFLIEHKYPIRQSQSAGVRTTDYKYNERVIYDGSIIRELYDLRKDPYELNNIAKNPAYSNVKQELKQRLLQLKQE